MKGPQSEDPNAWPALKRTLGEGDQVERGPTSHEGGGERILTERGEAHPSIKRAHGCSQNKKKIIIIKKKIKIKKQIHGTKA